MRNSRVLVMSSSCNKVLEIIYLNQYLQESRRLIIPRKDADRVQADLALPATPIQLGRAST